MGAENGKNPSGNSVVILGIGLALFVEFAGWLMGVKPSILGLGVAFLPSEVE